MRQPRCESQLPEGGKMAGDQSFQAQQRAVAIRMLVAIVATVLIACLVAALTRSAAPQSIAHRVQWLVRAELCVGVWLAASIANVARLRFISSDDIAGSSSGQGSRAVRNASSMLQNTLEQAVLAAIAYAGIALSVDRPNIWLLSLAGTFSIGRALFWSGYSRGAEHRALGFALTFYPSLAALAVSIILTITGAGA